MKVFSNFFCQYIELLWNGTEKTNFGPHRKTEHLSLIGKN